MTIHQRLTKARVSAGYQTAADAARALKVKEQTYYAHENGNSGLRASVAEKYAKKFRVSLEWLLTGKGEPDLDGVASYEIEVAGLPLLGSIQAGVWLETTFLEQESEPEMVPVVRDPRFPHARQYALKVLGDSMDLDYPEGSIVTCVSFAETGMSLTPGMTVHVERQRAGGQLVEITLKYVERRKGQMCLVPRSSNPIHVAFPVNDSGTDTDIVVKGIVTGGWRPAPIPSLN